VQIKTDTLTEKITSYQNNRYKKTAHDGLFFYYCRKIKEKL